MERILQSHQVGPPRVDFVKSLDDDGQEYVAVVEVRAGLAGRWQLDMAPAR